MPSICTIAYGENSLKFREKAQAISKNEKSPISFYYKFKEKVIKKATLFFYKL